MGKKYKTIKMLEAENSMLRAKVKQMQSIIKTQSELIGCYVQTGMLEAGLEAAAKFDKILEQATKKE